MPWSALAGIALCIYLAAGLPAVTWWRFGIWLCIGLVLYFMYGFRRSGLNKRL
jgi:APA family basic amino acid/polyamine antiporter